MDENETQIIDEPQIEESAFKKHFCTVTPFSKYLAIVLFVTLPFVGFWFGLTLNSSQQVEDVASIEGEANFEDEIVERNGQIDLLSDSTSSPVEKLNEYIKIEQLTKFSYSNRDKSNIFGAYKAITSDSVVYSEGVVYDFRTGKRSENKALQEAIEVQERVIEEEIKKELEETITDDSGFEVSGRLKPMSCNQQISWYEDGVLYYQFEGYISSDNHFGEWITEKDIYAFSIKDNSLVSKNILSNADNMIDKAKITIRYSESGRPKVALCTKDSITFQGFDNVNREHIGLKFLLDSDTVEVLNEGIPELTAFEKVILPGSEELLFKSELESLPIPTYNIIRAADEHYFVFASFVERSGVREPLIAAYEPSLNKWYHNKGVGVDINYKNIILWKGNLLVSGAVSKDWKPIDEPAKFSSLRHYVGSENLGKLNLYALPYNSEVKVSDNALFILYDDGFYSMDVYVIPEDL